MYYVDIAITIIGIFFTLYYTIINIVKRYRFAVNRLFSCISFTAFLIAASLLFLLVFPDSPYTTLAGRGIFCFLLIAAQLFFHLSQIFPRWEKRSPFWFIILPIIPGIAVALMTLLTNLIIAETKIADFLNYSFGKFFILYIISFGLFIVGTFSILLDKSRHMENESFRKQLFYMSQGTNFAGLIILVFMFLLPIAFDIHDYKNIGLITSGIILIGVINYAVSDERMVDFKQFYLRALYWITVTVSLGLPVYLLLYYRTVSIILKRTPLPIITFIIFLYLFLFFRIVRPRIERFFRREYLTFERNVNEFFEELTQLADAETEEYWDIFLHTAIDRLESRFDISKASFYMYNATGKNYTFSYSFGEKIPLSEIDQDSILIKALSAHAHVLDKSMIFTDEQMSDDRESLLSVFNDTDSQVILPFFNYEREIIGLLFLGPLKNNEPYSFVLLSVLELYRIQFELNLANSILLEEIKVAQKRTHDKLVISNIKKKIKPTTLKQVESIRLSSLYIDNSEYGGDYFDSVLVSPNKLCLFIANTSDLGVESALLALELYTILHMQPEKFQFPEQVLNTMNWVISTSQFSEKYAPAFTMMYAESSRELTYSNAAFNPLLIFDSTREIFTELETKGIPIGVERSFSYETKALKPLSESIGVLYSDGLVSAYNESGENYSLGRVKDIIRLNKDVMPSVLIRMIYKDFKDFVQGTKLINDISLIIMKII